MPTVLPRILVFVLALAAASAAGIASSSTVFERNGVAIRGYDPVAYFRESKPVRGSDSFRADWDGATWNFASSANRDAFLADPGKYAPQYGGYCAWAVSQGYTAPVSPEAWRIVEGKLYLNYSTSVQRTWEEDVPGNIVAADGNWPSIRRKLASK